MKATKILLALFIAVSFCQTGQSQDYDWDVLHNALKKKNEALSKIAEANTLLNSTQHINLSELPKQTIVNLATASESWHLELLNAISKFKKKATFDKLNELLIYEGRLPCYTEYEKQLTDLIEVSYSTIQQCSERNTACHLSALQVELQPYADFEICMKSTYGKSKLGGR